MKRRAFQILMLLILGAVVNIAVALGCAFWPGQTPGGRSAFAEDVAGENDLMVFRYDHPRKLKIQAVTGDLESGPYMLIAIADGIAPNSSPSFVISPYVLVPGWSRHELLPWGGEIPWPENDGHDSRTIVATGWPMLTLWASFDQIPNPVGYWGWKARHGILLPKRWQPREVLGLGQTPSCWGTQPIWPGFAINTIFYAVVLWVVFFVPGMVKRTLRRRRGLCPACAYPIGTSPVCTECGASIPSPLRERVRVRVGRTDGESA